jgi:hypothetical protein
MGPFTMLIAEMITSDGYGWHAIRQLLFRLGLPGT